MTLVFTYIFVTATYTMPFLKAASENTLLLAIIEVADGRFIATPFPPCCLNESDYFLPRFVDLGLHFGAKSSCPSNAQIL